MSYFIGIGRQLNQTRTPSEYLKTEASGFVDRPWEDGLLWSRSRMTGSVQAWLSEDAASSAVWGAWPATAGCCSMNKIIGTTRDSAGAELGSCVVQGFVTATDGFVRELTSDAGGYFELCTPYTGAHYLVCYKAGSPDIAGTSVNTLVGV